jgi:hypothetical protein
MIRQSAFRNSFTTILRPSAVVVCLTAFVVAWSATVAQGGLNVNQNSTWPAAPALQTIPRTDAGINSERDARFNRNLLQTFQVPSAFQIDKVFIDYEEGIADKEVTLRLFTAPDVNAATILEPENAGFAGTVLIPGLTFSTTSAIITADGGNNPLGVLEFDLTGTDEVTLASSTGTAGYVFQLRRTGTGADIDDTAQRAFKWHFNSGGSLYAGGRAFQVNGTGGPSTTSDFALAMTAVPEPSTMVLAVLAASGVLAACRRRRAR